MVTSIKVNSFQFMYLHSILLSTPYHRVEINMRCELLTKALWGSCTLFLIGPSSTLVPNLFWNQTTHTRREKRTETKPTQEDSGHPVTCVLWDNNSNHDASFWSQWTSCLLNSVAVTSGDLLSESGWWVSACPHHTVEQVLVSFLYFYSDSAFRTTALHDLISPSIQCLSSHCGRQILNLRT